MTDQHLKNSLRLSVTHLTSSIKILKKKIISKNKKNPTPKKQKQKNKQTSKSKTKTDLKLS